MRYGRTVPIAIILGIYSAFLTPADAAVPGTITIQGTLEDSDGDALTGTYDYRVRFYDLESGGPILGVLTGSVSVSDAGRFSIELIPPQDALDADATWYELAVDESNDGIDPDDVFPNRVNIHSVPFALRSADSQSLGGQPASSFLTTASGTSSGWSLDGNAGTAGKFLGTTDDQPLDFQVNGTRAFKLEPTFGTPNLIGGDSANSVDSGVHGGTISGGGESISPNKVTGNFGVVAGGSWNTAGSNSAVGGGKGNFARGASSAIAGGFQNDAAGEYSAIGGGFNNVANGTDCVIAGGYGNLVQGVASTIGGGYDSWISNASYATIAGGGPSNPMTPLTGNQVLSDYGTIGGGAGNQAGDNAAFGLPRTFATVAGGGQNMAGGRYAAVGGGQLNRATGEETVIAGGSSNSAGNWGAFVGGGSGNDSQGAASVVAGGLNNTARGDYSFVGGGNENVATGDRAVIGGGELNRATGQYLPTIAGGLNNIASGQLSTVGGGGGNGSVGVRGNYASGDWSTVSGGDSNTASGAYATVPGGFSNTATGEYGFAAGRRAKAADAGSFVWADSTNGNFYSQGTDSFNIRAGAGVYADANNGNYGARFQNNGNGDGIRALANVSQGTNWGALFASNSGTSPGIYAYSTAGPAGFFDGDVTVVGSLTTSSGTYKIDHPLDPKNKTLQQYSVGSSELKNVYDGVAILDSNGEAWVELPEWFEALNGEFRYQLTCIGKFQPVYIAQEIENNRFQIGGGDPDTKICWQVTSVRNDPYAKSLKTPSVEEKPIKKRGTYLHPEAYGVPRTNVKNGLAVTNGINKKAKEN